MSNSRYGADERQAGGRGAWSRDDDRDDDRVYGPSQYDRAQYDRGQYGREREVGRDSRSFSARDGGGSYSGYGQGLPRFSEADDYRPGYGDYREAGGRRADAYGEDRSGAYGRSYEGDYGRRSNPYGYGAGARDYEGRYGGRSERAIGPDNPMLANLAEGRDATAGLHRGRGPKNYVRSDERIREDVSDRLSDDAHLDASAIEVQVVNGEVTLVGSVDSRHAKRRAEDRAEDVSGVKHVQNNLRVGEASAVAATGAETGSLGPLRTHN